MSRVAQAISIVTLENVLLAAQGGSPGHFPEATRGVRAAWPDRE